MNGWGNALAALGISVLASLLTILLLWLKDLVWERLWLKVSCRQVLDIAGDWKAQYDDENHKYSETMRLKQYGWRLAGTFHVRSEGQSSAALEHRNYDIEGRIRGTSVVCSFTNAKRSDTRCGAMTLRIRGAGSELEGKYLFQDDEGRVHDSDIFYLRDGGSE